MVLFAGECHIQSLSISSSNDPTPAQNDPASSSSAHRQSWSNPRTPTRSSPVPKEKRESSVGAVCGNDSSYINITDFSVTDGIDSEYKQEQRSKGARSTGRCGQQTSWAGGSNAGQYERSGSTPPRQPTPDRRVRAAYQTNAASTGDATDPGRSQYSPPRRVIRS